MAAEPRRAPPQFVIYLLLLLSLSFVWGTRYSSADAKSSAEEADTLKPRCCTGCRFNLALYLWNIGTVRRGGVPPAPPYEHALVSRPAQGGRGREAMAATCCVQAKRRLVCTINTQCGAGWRRAPPSHRGPTHDIVSVHLDAHSPEAAATPYTPSGLVPVPGPAWQAALGAAVAAWPWKIPLVIAPTSGSRGLRSSMDGTRTLIAPPPPAMHNANEPPASVAFELDSVLAAAERETPSQATSSV